MHLLSASPRQKLDALQANLYFDHLEPAELDRMIDRVSLHEFARGEILFLESDPCSGLYILQSGAVKLYRISPQGRQYIVRIVQEGDTFNEVAVFDGKFSPVNAETIEPTKAWIVEADCLRSLVASNPEFAARVINNLGQNLRMLIQSVSEMAFYQVTHRLARLLSSMPESEPGGSGPTRWTQEQLAARLGTVREVVARSLRELERTGAIQTRNRRITIADAHVLEQWTQGPWN